METLSFRLVLVAMRKSGSFQAQKLKKKYQTPPLPPPRIFFCVAWFLEFIMMVHLLERILGPHHPGQKQFCAP